MKLTDRKLKEYFPRDNRFIYFVANRYGLNFYNEEDVESARFQSYINIHNYIKRNGDVFESEEHLTGIVMSLIRYGILNAMSKAQKRRERLKISVEADLVYANKDGDESYNKYQNHAIHIDDEYDEMEAMADELYESLTRDSDKTIFTIARKGNYDTYELAELSGYTPQTVLVSKRRIRKALTELTNLKETNGNKENTDNHHNDVQEISGELLREDADRRLYEEQRKEYRYSTAMSFLYS